MHIIDGEVLTFICQDCKQKFPHIIGYGPLYPTIDMRKEALKKNPPICPKCGSKKVKRTLIGRLLDLIN